MSFFKLNSESHLLHESMAHSVDARVRQAQAQFQKWRRWELILKVIGVILIAVLFYSWIFAAKTTRMAYFGIFPCVLPLALIEDQIEEYYRDKHFADKLGKKFAFGRSIEETTRVATAQREVPLTAEDRRWIRRRQRDLITCWIALLLWFIPFLHFYDPRFYAYLVVSGPVILAMMWVEDLVEQHYRRKHHFVMGLPHPELSRHVQDFHKAA